VRRGLENALDDYLVLLSQSGSRDAFARLVARWTTKLAAFAARNVGQETAMDVVQDTWEGAWRGLKSLDDPARFRVWLYGIAARKCADALRGKYARARASEAAGDAPPPRSDDPDASLDLAAALQTLPPEQRVAVSLYFGEDMGVAEIATITGVPTGTVKSRLFAARHALRAALEGELK
jgi:RNA polymerase sigma-70 factor (ECF subfamily)